MGLEFHRLENDGQSFGVWKMTENDGLENDCFTYKKLEMWANAQRDGRPLNIGGALCSTPQSLADAHYWSAVQ